MNSVADRVISKFSEEWFIIDTFISLELRQRKNTLPTSLNTAFQNGLALQQARLVVLVCLSFSVLLLILAIDFFAHSRFERGAPLACTFFVLLIPLVAIRHYSSEKSMLSVSHWVTVLVVLSLVCIGWANTINGGFCNPSLFATAIPASIALASGSRTISWMTCAACIVLYLYLYFLHVFDYEFSDDAFTNDPEDLVFGYLFCLVLTLIPMMFHHYNSQDSIQALSIVLLELEQAHRTKSEYVSKMSHELRSPLHAVLAMMELAIAELAKAKPLVVAELLRDAMFAGRCLKALVNNVLTFTKAEAGGIELENRPVEVPRLVNHAVNIIKIQRKDKQVEFTTQTDVQCMSGDSTRLMQILLNFVGNASKFTSKGRVHIEVKQMLHEELVEYCADAYKVEGFPVNSLEDDPQSSSLSSFGVSHSSSPKAFVGPWVTFIISDEGPGIPPESLSQIFKPFTQVDSSITRKFGGTGLGLAISRELIRCMGGRLWVQSKYGSGSTFGYAVPYEACKGLPQGSPSVSRVGGTHSTAQSIDIELAEIYEDVMVDNGVEIASPMVTVSVAPKEDKNTGVDGVAEIANDANNKAPTMKFLVVDDSQINRRIFVRTLESMGHTNVHTANSGEEGVAMFEESMDFDVVFLDVHMPTMCGYQVCKKIRQLEADNHIVQRCAVFAFTADTEDTVLTKCRDSGMNAIISKPAGRNDIDRAIHVLLPQLRQHGCIDWLDFGDQKQP